jgi:hypothetical protein
VELTKEQQIALAAPFLPDQVSWRVQGKPTANTRCQVVAYVDARDVQDRLDSAVGAGNWTFDWTPIVTNATGLLVAKGTITIFGVSKSDVGDASTIEGTKGTVSDAFKRTAVMWGPGRELYALGKQEALLDARGHIPPNEMKRLKAILTGEPLPAQSHDAQPQKPMQPAATSQAPQKLPQQLAQPATAGPTIDERKAKLKQDYEALGYRGSAAWNQLCLNASGRSAEELAQGFTHQDLNKIATQIALLKKQAAQPKAVPA